MQAESTINYHKPEFPFLCKPNTGEDIIFYAFASSKFKDGTHYNCVIIYSNHIDYELGQKCHIHYMEVDALPKGSVVTLTQD